MFKDFGRKLQRGVQRIVDHRLKATEQLSGGNLKVGFTVLLSRSENYNSGHYVFEFPILYSIFLNHC